MNDVSSTIPPMIVRYHEGDNILYIGDEPYDDTSNDDYELSERQRSSAAVNDERLFELLTSNNNNTHYEHVEHKRRDGMLLYLSNMTAANKRWLEAIAQMMIVNVTIQHNNQLARKFCRLVMVKRTLCVRCFSLCLIFITHFISFHFILFV
jgi:hypothetical protein